MNDMTPIKSVTMRTPFPDHQISKLPKATKAQNEAVKANFKAGIRCTICGGWHHPDVVHLDYVGHAALTDRLLDVDPDWSWEPVALAPDGLPAFDRNGGLWIRLTILGVTRLGYGDADGKTGGNAVKEAIGDALRNAAMRFGAALDLWHKGDLHLDANEGETGGQSQGDAVNPPPAKAPKGWREEGSPYSTPSALHKACTGFERELMGCGDSDMVYGLTGTPEWIEFVRVSQKHSPHYLRGGEPAPPEFEGLLNIAERLVREFDSATANNMAALGRT